MRFRSAHQPLSLVILAFALGCQPKIGDECQTSVDCSQGTERLCDITQPGGYCTVFNCEPGVCPEDSVCIAFGAALSPAAGCDDANGLSRRQRSFCMATCSSNDDCRAGYVCADLGGTGNDWNATLIDRGSSGKVCSVPASGRTNASQSSDICFGTGVGGSAGAPSTPGGVGGSGGTAGAPSTLAGADGTEG